MELFITTAMINSNPTYENIADKIPNVVGKGEKYFSHNHKCYEQTSEILLERLKDVSTPRRIILT
jgi:hypothetical protein